MAVAVAGALIVPLAWMAWSGHGQPEVSVVIRSAALFLHHGTPYQGAHTVATAHNPYVYNPYLPALAVFGVPHALFGGGPLTDPRLWFGVVFVLGFAGTLALTGVRRPWLWTAVVTASPVIAFPLVTGGDDLPVLALICVGLALLRDGRRPRPELRIVLAGLALGLASAMKATAWPALAVAVVLVATRGSKRAAAWLACAAIAVPIAVDGPVLFAQPSAVVSNTILFPLGLTKIQSPAASFLPGHLIARPGGRDTWWRSRWCCWPRSAWARPWSCGRRGTSARRAGGWPPGWSSCSRSPRPAGSATASTRSAWPAGCCSPPRPAPGHGDQAAHSRAAGLPDPVRRAGAPGSTTGRSSR